MRVAIIGSGISGALVARLLHDEHEVTLFEASPTAGGHAHTVDISVENRQIAVDTGFMVFNERTYPNFCRLLDFLDVGSQPSDMSFSVSCARTGLEYQGSSLDGLFAQRRNLFSPTFYRLLLDILRFNRRGTLAAARGSIPVEQTVWDFLSQQRLGRRFIDQYLVPMASSIWSSRPQDIRSFPAHFLIGFFSNHGLMQLRNRPSWRTIAGGSRTYVNKLLAPLGDRLRLGTPVGGIKRREESVVVLSGSGEELFDQVVLATHADQSLRLLMDANPIEEAILSQFPYQNNHAILHTDLRHLPKRRRAWASWNYRISPLNSQPATVTYDLNRLQNLGLSQPLLLTLNPSMPVDDKLILREFNFTHPAYGSSSVSAQQLHDQISGLSQRTHFCGAYWGYGFHEDGVNSALAVASHFGISLDSCIAASTRGSSPTAVSIQ
jgi:predicted NAD/FAD-binding protein